MLTQDLIRVDYGWMGEEYYLLIKETVERIKKEIGTVMYSNALKLIVVHHPLDYGNQDVYKKISKFFIKQKSAILLCGHQHKMGISNESGYVPIIKCSTLSGNFQEMGLSCNLYNVEKESGGYRFKIHRMLYRDDRGEDSFILEHKIHRAMQV